MLKYSVTTIVSDLQVYKEYLERLKSQAEVELWICQEEVYKVSISFCNSPSPGIIRHG